MTTLEPLPGQRETVIVVGTTTRKPLPHLRAYLDSLAWQDLPERTRLHFVFVPDFVGGQELAAQALATFVSERNGELLQGVPSDATDFYDGPGADSHQWTPSAMSRVGRNKNLIIRRALELKADYLFFADADLILDRTTIRSLLSVEKPIATACYWTRWSKQGSETQRIHAAPQVWLQHPYQLFGRGLEEAEFRYALANREITKVWGYGACTLIRREVLEAGVSFEYLPDVPQTGLMAGEDRHFCIRAERKHIDAWADPWPDIFHIYHDDDVAKIPDMVGRLGASHQQSPKVGDLVSLRLRPLEPVPVGPGRYHLPQPVMPRGRLGALPLAPEIEETVVGMTRGEKRIVRVHFPIYATAPFLRGRTRLIEVSLVDCKPNGFPPVLEDEVYVGRRSGVALDQTALNDEQHASIREIGGAA